MWRTLILELLQLCAIERARAPVGQGVIHIVVPMTGLGTEHAMAENSIQYVFRESGQRRDGALPAPSGDLVHPLQRLEHVRAPPPDHIADIVDIALRLDGQAEQICRHRLPAVIGRNEATLSRFEQPWTLA